MALYEIKDEVKQFLLAILSRCDIKGADAPMLVQAAQELQSPVPPLAPKADDKTANKTGNK